MSKVMTELQKAAEWVRHARTNHAIYRDASSEAELEDALKAFNKELDKAK